MASRKDCKYFNACGNSDNCSRCDGYAKKVCCICGKKFTEYGNDPWPIEMDEAARCCDACNSFFVLPARLEMMMKGGR